VLGALASNAIRCNGRLAMHKPAARVSLPRYRMDPMPGDSNDLLVRCPLMPPHESGGWYEQVRPGALRDPLQQVGGISIDRA